MAVDWETVPLDSLIEPGRGITYGIVQPGAAVSDGVPIVRVSDVRDGRIAVSNPLRVAPAIEASSSRTRLAGSELLLTLVGTVGETAVVPESLAGWNTARAVAVIPVRKEVGAYWVQMALRAPGVRAIIDSRLNTTVQATLNLGDVAQLPIVLPPLREREAIAHILGTLDDKIELNRRMNETLEAIARALFKSWFVDFDPVRAKAEGRDHGLPQPLADLFPDSFEDSELGEIPKGWEVVNLNDVADINYGQNLPQTELLGCGIPVFGAAGVIGYYSEAMFKDPIVLVTSRGSGSGTVHETHGPSFVTNNSFSVIPKDGWFSRHYLKASLLNGDISSLVTGSAQPQLTITNFSYLKLVRPAESVAREFHSFADSLWQKKNANQNESHTLAALRDTLLPKLISGELRVAHPKMLTEAMQ